MNFKTPLLLILFDLAHRIKQHIRNSWIFTNLINKQIFLKKKIASHQTCSNWSKNSWKFGIGFWIRWTRCSPQKELNYDPQTWPTQILLILWTCMHGRQIKTSFKDLATFMNSPKIEYKSLFLARFVSCHITTEAQCPKMRQSKMDLILLFVYT